MRRIRISTGRYALVDDADYVALRAFSWREQKGYACRWARKEEGGGGRSFHKIIFMHRVVMKLELDRHGEGAEVDHRNGKRLDNRRLNLRVTDRAGNGMNKGPRRGRKYKGVRRVLNGSWVAGIRVRGKQIHLGTFSTAVEAAVAYDVAARVHFGTFARLNMAVA